jgi:hypothetical protein
MVKGAGGVKDNNDAGIIRKEVSSAFKSASSRNAVLFRGLLEKYDDGDVNAKFVFDIFRQVEDLQNRARIAIAEWRKRFEAKVSSNGKGKP